MVACVDAAGQACLLATSPACPDSAHQLEYDDDDDSEAGPGAAPSSSSVHHLLRLPAPPLGSVCRAWRAVRPQPVRAQGLQRKRAAVVWRMGLA